MLESRAIVYQSMYMYKCIACEPLLEYRVNLVLKQVYLRLCCLDSAPECRVTFISKHVMKN